MNILSNIIPDLLHITGILMVCSSCLKLEEKTSDTHRYLKAILVSICASMVINTISNVVIALIIYLLCVLLVLRVCYLDNIKKIIICSVWTSIVIEIIDMISMSLLNTVLGIVMDFNSDSFYNIATALLSLSFITIVSWLLGKITNDGIKNISIKYLLLFTAILFADLFILSLMANVTMKQFAYKNKVLYIVVYISVTIGLFIQMGSVILLLVSRNMYKEKELVIKQYLEEQVKQYEYLKEREKETKKFRHDIRGHLYILNKLKAEGNNQEFDEYFKDIIEKVDDLGNNINVGNDIVNAVLNKANTEAKNKNIKLSVTGHFPTRCNISAYDLCTIFFNLLSNAIEAAEKTVEKEVWVICGYTKKEIIVEIGNYYCNDNAIDKNKLQTTKKEKEYHGWGMKNVEDSVENCKGLMDIEISDDKFIVSITLKNEKEDSAK